jgi:hypothetical protein
LVRQTDEQTEALRVARAALERIYVALGGDLDVLDAGH